MQGAVTKVPVDKGLFVIESSNPFLRFHMKKRVQQTAKGSVTVIITIIIIILLVMPSWFRHGRIFKGGSPLRPSVELSRVQTKKQSSPRVVEPFNEFLKTLRKPAAQDILTHLKT